MPSIPTLIVAPAILAAGIAYKYTGNDERQGRGRLQDSQEYLLRYGGKRRSSNSNSQEQASNWDSNDRLQHTNEFIPTNMVGSNLQRYPGESGNVNSLATQTGEAKYQPRRHANSEQQFDSYQPQGITKKVLPSAIIGPYPRSDKEREHAPWFYKATRNMTLDLGPIEHQDDKKLQERDALQEASIEHIAAPLGDKSPHPTLTKTAKYASDSPVAKASRAAEDITDKGVRKEDANQAAMNVSKDKSADVKSSLQQKQETQGANGNTGWFGGSTSGRNAGDSVKDGVEETADNARGWFWSKKKDVDDESSKLAESAKQKGNEAVDNAKETADETRGWFWNKKRDVEDAASDAAESARQKTNEAVDSAKETADNARGWFWSKKQDAENTASDMAESAKQKTNEAVDNVKETADETRGWFWNKKQDVEDSASNMAESAKQKTNEAVDNVKETADKTSSWFWSKKQDVQDAASDTAESARQKTNEAVDSAKETADNARGWFWSKKQDAENTASNMAESVKQKTNEAVDNVKETADETRGWFWNKAQDTRDTASNAATSAEQGVSGATQSAMQGASDAAGSLSQGAKDAAGSLKQGAKGAGDSMHQVGTDASNWMQGQKQNAQDSARGAAEEAGSWFSGKTDDLGRSIDSSRSTAWNAATKAEDSSRAWLWDKTSQADHAISNAANAVERTAEQASTNAQQRANAARNAAADIPSRDPSIAGQKEGSWYARRDSAVGDDLTGRAKAAGDSVAQTLDTKFDEARAALRATGEDLRAMAENAMPHSSGEGLIDGQKSGREIRSVGGISGTSASDAANRAAALADAADARPEGSLRFVENHSGIPVIDSSSR
ncbi:hypothetical protein IWW36_002045 [Coemansia brasiliensis]|uniref:Uncharacterized protein n=1 Tax=Coemansia brasiliensis TaxID=2650707 RepID=A0A9W8ICS9_9FUNG|nr:hypothetical protein IWW36_002045 [Coemansia brasiliensis]